MMDYNLKHSIARRMMQYVKHYYIKTAAQPDSKKLMYGVFADINETFNKCDNTGLMQHKHRNSNVSHGFKRYKFKGFNWTEETLMFELDKLYKKYVIKIKIEKLNKDFI